MKCLMHMQASFDVNCLAQKTDDFDIVCLDAHATLLDVKTLVHKQVSLTSSVYSTDERGFLIYFFNKCDIASCAKQTSLTSGVMCIHMRL